jgi:hypothetical protein
LRIIFLAASCLFIIILFITGWMTAA